MSYDQPDRFMFGGHDLTELLYVNPSLGFGTGVEDVTVEVPGRPGERFIRTKLKPRQIPLHVRLRMDQADPEAVSRQIDMITYILSADHPCPLILPNEPTRYYMAKLTDPGELDALRSTGVADIEMTAYDPIKFGRDRTEDITEAGRMRIHVEGTWETYPVFTLQATSGSVSLSIDGAFVKLATDPEPGSEIVIDMANENSTVNGEYAPVEMGSDYWPFTPGNNFIEIAGAVGTVAWTERWR